TWPPLNPPAERWFSRGRGSTGVAGPVTRSGAPPARTESDRRAPMSHFITKCDPVENCGAHRTLAPVDPPAVKTGRATHGSTRSTATQRARTRPCRRQCPWGSDPQMKSPPPPPVDRIERTVNPVALTILLVCLAGALLAVRLAPNAIGATLMTWMIVILAVCGAFGLL